MNYAENLNDGALTRELRNALFGVATPQPPPLAAITSRGRARRRRRFAAFAGLGLTGVAAGTALAVGLTGAIGETPARSTAAMQPSAPAHSTGTIPSGAFILTSNVDGTDTLTLTMNQMLNSATLQQALTQHGIAALVRTDSYCSSSPSAPDPATIGVLATQLPTGLPRTMVPAPSGPAPSDVTQMAANTATVINPAAIPSGTELFFGYSSGFHAVFTDLIDTDSYTCSSNP
jgi:hypothetical protein